MSAAKLKLAPRASFELRDGPSIANTASNPVTSPARELQMGLSDALSEHRWSKRRTLAFVGITNASLWGLIIIGGITLLG